MQQAAAVAERAPAAHRYELKLVCPETAMTAATAELWVRSHRAGFGVTYPARRVNSVYFDTHTWSNLADNLAGAAERYKLRLRWYGLDTSAVKGQLEVKQKRGHLGRKITHHMERVVDLSTMSWSSILNALRGEQLGALMPYVQANWRPTTMIAYDRQYYVSADNLVRLTIDTSITVYDQTLSAHPNIRNRTPMTPTLVLELKASSDHRNHLADISRDFPIRPAANSKYVNAIVASSQSL